MKKINPICTFSLLFVLKAQTQPMLMDSEYSSLRLIANMSTLNHESTSLYSQSAGYIILPDEPAFYYDSLFGGPSIVSTDLYLAFASLDEIEKAEPSFSLLALPALFTFCFENRNAFAQSSESLIIDIDKNSIYTNAHDSDFIKVDNKHRLDCLCRLGGSINQLRQTHLPEIQIKFKVTESVTKSKTLQKKHQTNLFEPGRSPPEKEIISF